MKQEVIGQVKKFMSVFVSACTMHIILLSDRRILVNMLRENFSDTSLKFVSRRGPQRVNVVNIIVHQKPLSLIITIRKLPNLSPSMSLDVVRQIV